MDSTQEVAFPEAEVRFIAINNGVDSASKQDSDFLSILNSTNEWYVNDTSKKIRAVFKAKGQSGYGPSKIAKKLEDTSPLSERLFSANVPNNPYAWRARTVATFMPTKSILDIRSIPKHTKNPINAIKLLIMTHRNVRYSKILTRLLLTRILGTSSRKSGMECEDKYLG